MKIFPNTDQRTVEGFGNEWTRFDQKELTEEERIRIFHSYFHLFPWSVLPENAVGVDVGSGSGRWAMEVSKRISMLHCVDASSGALNVARTNLAARTNCHFHLATASQLPFSSESLDMCYSLGVLHHIPDTQAGIRECARVLKKGAPFLIYLYYRFDNRAIWYVWLWRISDFFRKSISMLRHSQRSVICDLIAFFVYYPTARTAKILEKLGLAVDSFPLSSYRNHSFYTMRTDALDRFGTGLEKRFTKKEIEDMLLEAGFENIRFSDTVPFWCAVGCKK